VSIRSLLTATAVAIAGVYLVILLVFPEALFAFTFDDGFYYLGIARNLANGEGSTWDTIEATNGYHPLWMAMVVPFYLVGLDGFAAARAVVIFQLGLYAAALVVVARMIGDLIGDWPRLADPALRRLGSFGVVVAFALVAGNPFVVRTFVNGLESGAVVLVGALVLAYAMRGTGRWVTDDVEHRRRWIMSALLVLAFLARTDAIVLGGCLGLWCLAEARQVGRPAIARIAQLFGPLAVTLVVFLVANQVGFDTPMQVSGLVKRADLDLTRVVGMALIAAGALGFGVLGYRRSHRDRTPADDGSPRFPRVSTLVGRTSWYGAFGLLLIGYYTLLQVQQWLWYYGPVVLYLLVLLVVGLADFVEAAVVEAADAAPDRSGARAVAPILALILVPLAVLFVMQIGTVADPNLRSIQLANRDAGEWIDANLPADAVLASWDAGVLGYFAERPVVNLDGVVNSKAFVDARDAGELGPFLAERGVGFVANHGTEVDGNDPESLAFIATTFGAGTADDTELVQAWPFEFSGVIVNSGFEGGTGGRQKAVFLYRLPSPLPEIGA
jgi:hypothetical protein